MVKQYISQYDCLQFLAEVVGDALVVGGEISGVISDLVHPA